MINQLQFMYEKNTSWKFEMVGKFQFNQSAPEGPGADNSLSPSQYGSPHTVCAIIWNNIGEEGDIKIHKKSSYMYQ